jgi:hypothetical protein
VLRRETLLAGAACACATVNAASCDDGAVIVLCMQCALLLLAACKACANAVAAGFDGNSSSLHQLLLRVCTPAGAGASVAAAAASKGACLAGVNRLASEALAGLLWPLSQQDALAGRSSVRQLVSTQSAASQQRRCWVE